MVLTLTLSERQRNRVYGDGNEAESEDAEKFGSRTDMDRANRCMGRT